MPYIADDEREDLLDGVMPPQGPGHLNFLLTTQVNDYMIEHGLSYQSINDVLGALEGAKAEFYRRVAAPYEDTKRASNSEVYDHAPLETRRW